MDEWHNEESPLQVLAGYVFIMIVVGVLALLTF